ncbi:hypothetical protein AB9W60_003378 [Proteus mirabilis]|nr:hypothetical protein [Proteus mirabilis]
MLIKKITDSIIAFIYKTTDNYVIDQLNDVNLGKVELYKPTADSNTILRWDELFKNYMVRGFPTEIKDIITNLCRIEKTIDYFFDFNKIQSLTASKSFGGIPDGAINGSWFYDLYSWGRAMYPDERMKAENEDDWKRNIAHIESEGFRKCRPINVIYYEWLNRFVAPNTGGSHHAALVVYQSIRDKIKYTRETILEKVSLNSYYIRMLDNEYYSFIINNDSNPKSLSESDKFINVITELISTHISILKPVHSYQNLMIIFIPKESLKIDSELFNNWINKAHDQKKIINLPNYFRLPNEYHTKPYLHELRYLKMPNPNSIFQ